MISQYADDIAKAGGAFVGQGISDGTGVGNVALWNRWGSGKILLLDMVVLASSGSDGPYGADLRSIRATAGFTLFPDHWRNANGRDTPAPIGETYVMSGTAPNDYPFNRPQQEYWLDGRFVDEHYPTPYPLIIPQGRGESVSLSHAGACIASFAWREENDPLGAVWPYEGLHGTPIGDMLNIDRARDGVETTYATSDGDTTFTAYGLDLGAGNSSAVTRFLAKSPPTRSFCGAYPVRTINWTYATSPDGSAWTTQAAGSFTDALQTSQAVADLSVSGPVARMHRITLSTSAVSGWRLAEFEFHA